MSGKAISCGIDQRTIYNNPYLTPYSGTQYSPSLFGPMPQAPYGAMPPFPSSATFTKDVFDAGIEAARQHNQAQTAQQTTQAAQAAQQAQQELPIKGLTSSFVQYYIPKHLEKTWIEQGVKNFKYERCIESMNGTSDWMMAQLEGKDAIIEAVKRGERAGKITYHKPSIKMPKFGKAGVLDGVGEKIVGKATETTTLATEKVTEAAAKKASEMTAKEAQKAAENLAKRTALTGSLKAAQAETSAYQIGKSALKNSGKGVWFLAAAVATVETAIDGYKEYKTKGHVGLGTVKAGVENFCSAGLGTAAAIVGTALGTPAVGFIAGVVGGFVGKWLGKGINAFIGLCSKEYKKA